jgi:hypothetical protein
MKADLEGGEDFSIEHLDHENLIDSRVLGQSRYQVFEDYFWMLSHKEFEEQAKSAGPCFQKEGQ